MKIATDVIIGREAPIRLDVAAELAFPAGGVSVAVLRLEAKRGNLEVSRVGKSYFTTLAAIDRMMEACRVQPKVLTSTSGDGPGASQPGPSGTDQLKSAQAALNLTVAGLKSGSPRTSPKSTSQTSATVIRGEFPSPMCSPSTPRSGSR